MEEVIAKSKTHKVSHHSIHSSVQAFMNRNAQFQRQAQQEEDENLRHELDQELDSIRSLLFATDAPTTSEKLPEILGDNIQDEDQEYDQFVRELAFDQRAKPKDRAKTDEELAAEAKEALEKAERRRIRRMNGEDEESEDEDGQGKKSQLRQRGGDDLDDDFMEDGDDAAWNGLGSGLAEQQDSSPDAEDESDAAYEEDGAKEGISGVDVFLSPSEDESSKEDEDREPDVLIKSTKTRNAKSNKATQELPFTFSCPSSHEEFLDIVGNVEDKDVPTVVQRIRTLHHPSLAQDNKFKLQASRLFLFDTIFSDQGPQELTSVLIDHVLYIMQPPSPRFSLLLSLMPHLHALTNAYPIPSAEYFIAKLILMQKNFKRGLSRGPTELDAKTWPALPELSLLHVIGLVWSTSDKDHRVISPARLLMGAYLGLGRVRSLKDIASGLCLCTLFMHYESYSKRFVPEAINFLINTVLHLAPHKFKDASSLPGSFPAPDFRSERCLKLAITASKVKDLTTGKPDLFQLLGEGPFDEQAKLNLLGGALDLLGRFAEMYKSLDAFTELYEPIEEILASVNIEKCPEDLSVSVVNIRSTISLTSPDRLVSRHCEIPLVAYSSSLIKHVVH